MGSPVPGKRVCQAWPEFLGTQIHHTLYLPVDWRPDRRFPVIVEFAGNGDYRGSLGDVCDGSVEGCNLGYGISGGRGFIWICMPFVDPVQKRNAISWWGDADATVAYCRSTLGRVCEQFGGDPGVVLLTGFSRGAIACNYIGLRNDDIAPLWTAIFAHSHYDGVTVDWPYADADRVSAKARLRRLGRRPVLISHELSVEPTRRYLEESGCDAPISYLPLSFPNHTDAWVLRDIPERAELRAWVRRSMNL